MPAAEENELINVAIADSNPLMLSALSEFFDNDHRFSLVAAVATAENFLEVSYLTSINVGVIDWTLPRLGGERLLEIIRSQEKPPRMVVYAHGDNPDIPRLAMAAGAAGYCSRSKPAEYLLDTVASVAAGGMVFPFVDVRDLRQDPMHSLTKRERALLTSLAQGMTNKELAREYDISVNTVKFHLRNLFDKLSVNNRAQAMAFYYSTQSSLPFDDPGELEED